MAWTGVDTAVEGCTKELVGPEVLAEACTRTAVLARTQVEVEVEVAVAHRTLVDSAVGTAAAGVGCTSVVDSPVDCTAAKACTLAGVGLAGVELVCHLQKPGNANKTGNVGCIFFFPSARR